MKNRILALVFVVLLVLSAFCGCKKLDDNNASETNTNKNYQNLNSNVKVIAESVNTWIFDKSAYEDNPATTFSYCITDLDQNGRVEIITTVDNADVTKTKYYELNEEKTALLPLECVNENDFSGNLSECKETECYQDPSDGRIYYVCTNDRKEIDESGAKQRYMSKVAVSIWQGKAYETVLATFNRSEETYTDKDGNEITAEEYENIVEKEFASFKKMNVTFDWKGCGITNFETEFYTTDQNFIQKLSKSYDGFKFK